MLTGVPGRLRNINNTETGKSPLTAHMPPEQTTNPMYSETCPAIHPADRIQKFFVRPFFLTLTIGIPFCIFKGLFGLAAIRVGTPSNPLLAGFGWFVVAWASIDLTMNAVRATGDLLHIPTPLEYCTLAEIGRYVRRPMVFLAVDTLLSFLIICLMLWSGWIMQLTQQEAYLWYAATTLNLISISLVSLYNEAKRAA